MSTQISPILTSLVKHKTAQAIYFLNVTRKSLIFTYFFSSEFQTVFLVEMLVFYSHVGLKSYIKTMTFRSIFEFQVWLTQKEISNENYCVRSK